MRSSTAPSRFSFQREFRRALSQSIARVGLARTLVDLGSALWNWLLEFAPERRRSRFGDLDFDFERGSDTTRSNVSMRTQLVAALLGTPYFASQPYLFHEMMEHCRLDWREFTFVDLGSGKGRALLMAADLPFRRVLGVELVPELHAAALANIEAYQDQAQQCFAIETLNLDVRDFRFPAGPLFVYLFNPFPKPVMEAVLENLRRALIDEQRPLYVAYRLPELEASLVACGFLKKLCGTEQWVLYSSRESNVGL